MNINLLLFPDFESLDVFGPVEVLGHMQDASLHFVSVSGGIVRGRQNGRIVTEPLGEADQTGILLIPGGQGTRSLVKDAAFIKKLASASDTARYVLTVCTGSALLAKTSLLNGRKATSNKKAFTWVQSVNSDVNWIGSARWVQDGKYYTSSGVSAGIDMALGFVADQRGTAAAAEIANNMEYLWNKDKDNDPFSVE